MNVLIVHAHPEPQSFCSAICTRAHARFRAQGHQVRVSDLYASGFNPVAGPDDFLERQDPDYLVYALEQRHAYEGGTLAPDIRAEVAKLLWCDLLVLNFPLYWCSVPAILKGWLDRVLISGLVYGGKRFYDRGGMAGKQALVTLTLGGPAHLFTPDGVHGPLDEMLRPLLRGTLGYAGFDVMPPWFGWHVPYASPAQREALLEAHQRHLDALAQMQPLRMPRLDAFDERLYPRSPLSA
ncbi:NAD(P)H dehydrogenase (quinone) [Sphaerotilus hippei]|uniref:NAD(P)H dehydrogenase (Quinone) n=1 Tax=Sphaerotilus hippei TaxID=744406 RepID=A0A318GUZ4_9BURK|nr:NAD(P)H-dependent oxidoreductase [Sphaerotilus hippei]PXW92307.1 NAD(P)H dehydrogenase (quinone) [Sphaerotilus hippei]